MTRLPYGQKLTGTVADVDKVDWTFGHGAMRLSGDHVMFYYKDAAEPEMCVCVCVVRVCVFIFCVCWML